LFFFLLFSGQTVRRLGRRPPGRRGKGGERRCDGCRRRPQWGGGRSMEATSRASNTNNHPAATANEGMLSSSSASTTRLSTGRQPLLAPGRRQLLLRLPRRDGDSRSARIRRSRPSPSRG
ncbi:Os06g0669150, partial [Oryza sativa Japonica Group]